MRMCVCYKTYIRYMTLSSLTLLVDNIRSWSLLEGGLNSHLIGVQSFLWIQVEWSQDMFFFCHSNHQKNPAAVTNGNLCNIETTILEHNTITHQENIFFVQNTYSVYFAWFSSCQYKDRSWQHPPLLSVFY